MSAPIEGFDPSVLYGLHTIGTQDLFVPPSSVHEADGIVTVRFEDETPGHVLELAHMKDGWQYSPGYGLGVKVSLWITNAGLIARPVDLIGRRGVIMPEPQDGYYSFTLGEPDFTPIALIGGPIALWLATDVLPRGISPVVTITQAAREVGGPYLGITVSLNSDDAALSRLLLDYTCGLMNASRTNPGVWSLFGGGDHA